MTESEKPKGAIQAGDKYIVRFPEGMRDQIAQAAKAANRSMNAEIVARLQSSFERPTDGHQREIEAHVRDFQNRSEMLAMRAELIKTRLDGLYMRAQLMQGETERLTMAAKTDADFARAEGSIKELKTVEAESAMLRNELDQLVQERASLMQQMEKMRSLLKQGRLELEERLANARNPKP